MSLIGAYLFFAGQLSAHEAWTGAAAASIGVVHVVLAQRAAERQFSLRAPWLRLARHGLVALACDTFTAGAALLRILFFGPGKGRACQTEPFHGGSESPRDATRRALVVLTASLAPNGFVAEIPPGRDGILVHRLVPAPATTFRLWPA